MSKAQNNQVSEKLSTLVKEYVASQSKKIVEDLDYEKRKISYTNKIKQNRQITKITGDEELVRAFLLTRLVNELGYKEEDIEIEREYNIGRPKPTKPRIDIIVKQKGKEDIFLYIEAKAPNEYEQGQDKVIEDQLFNLVAEEKGKNRKINYLVLYTCNIDGDKLKDTLQLINYEIYPSFELWKQERNFLDELPKHYGKALKKPYKKGKDKDLDGNFTKEKLETLETNLHNVLWGGGGTDDNIIFSSLVNLILAKIQDESEKENGEKYDFQSFAYKDEQSGKDVFETKEDLFERINKLYRRALKDRLNITDQNKLEKEFVINENKFSLSKLKYTVNKLEGLSFTEGKDAVNGKDILGSFFEGIIRNGFKQSKGQFFTHVNIVKFMLWSLQLDKLAIQKVNNEKTLPYLIDPSAGSGTFLIEYMKFITQCLKYRFEKKLSSSRQVKDKFESWFMPDNRENRWAETYIYGSDSNFDLGTAIKVNMILHGDGSANVFAGSDKGDGLLKFEKYTNANGNNLLVKHSKDKYYSDKEVNCKFDVIVTNPPFSVDLDNETKKDVAENFVFATKSSENLFIERWYQLLKPNGRFAAVLPESIFDTTENTYIRLFLYKYFKIKAVISIPQLTFEPYTSTKTSLLFAQKKTKEEIEHWNDIWKKYSDEYSKLKTRVENILDIQFKGKNKNKFPSIKDLSEKQEKKLLVRMLKDYDYENIKNLNFETIINKYKEELIELCKFDKDTVNVFGYVNSWWVFSEVSKELNYKIFMAEVENIGYKRTKRNEKITNNELYRVDNTGQIIVDDGILKTALDYMRQIQWD